MVRNDSDSMRPIVVAPPYMPPLEENTIIHQTGNNMNINVCYGNRNLIGYHPYFGN